MNKDKIIKYNVFMSSARQCREGAEQRPMMAPRLIAKAEDLEAKAALILQEINAA